MHSQHRHVKLAVKAPGRDLGMLGALLHVAGDALNNIGVIVAAVVIWFSESPARFYADPAVGMAIAVMILFSALPLVRRSGEILLQSAPQGVSLGDIKHDIEKESSLSLSLSLSLHLTYNSRPGRKKKKYLG